MKSKITEYNLNSEIALKAIYAQNIMHNFNRHSHESYIFGVVLNGVRVIDLESISRVYNVGEVFIISPFQEHSCFSLLDKGYDYVAISFSAKSIRKIIYQDKLCEIFQLFAELLGKISFEMQPIQEKLVYNFDSECKILFKNMLADNISDTVNKGVEFINKNYALKITLDDIAEYASMSKFNFQRTFLKEYGMTPTAFLDKRRVASALSLIKAGKSACMVALECGFADQSHLCKAVKRVTGVTIKNYLIDNCA